MRRAARSGRRPRGHILIEVLITGAVLAWALAGIFAGMSQGNALLGVSLKEQQANALAQQRVEELDQTSTAGWTLVAGTTVVEPDAGGLFGWTRTTTYSPLTATPMFSNACSPVPVITATVQVTSPAGTTAMRVAQKWKAY
jgi:hypothetical protein